MHAKKGIYPTSQVLPEEIPSERDVKNPPIPTSPNQEGEEASG